MNENKNAFEAPSAEVLTVTLSDEVGTSGRNGWDTNMFNIPEIQ